MITRFPILRRIVAFGLLAGLTATMGVPATAAPETFEMPTLLSVTGSAAFIGKQALESVQRLAASINAQGGIRGKMLHVSLQDTTSTPATAVQLLNGLISSNTQAVFGPTFTAECSALIPLIEKGPVEYCYAPGVHPKPGTFMFSGGVGSDSMAHSIANYFRLKGYKRIAIISSTDASGQDFEENYEKAMAEPANSAMQTVAREHFSTSDLSVQAQIARIKAAKPETLIVWTAGTGLGVALHGVHDVDLDVPIMAGNGNMVRAQLTGYEAFVPKILEFPGVPGMTPLANESAGVKAAQAQYFGAYAKDGLKPDLPGALSWDPTHLILDAYKAIGWNATSEQIRSWIASQKAWPGVNGIYDFSKYPQRGIGTESCVIDRWDPKAHDFVAVSAAGGVVK